MDMVTKLRLQHLKPDNPQEFTRGAPPRAAKKRLEPQDSDEGRETAAFQTRDNLPQTFPLRPV